MNAAVIREHAGPFTTVFRWLRLAPMSVSAAGFGGFVSLAPAHGICL
jgi:hypothetical protein